MFRTAAESALKTGTTDNVTQPICHNVLDKGRPDAAMGGGTKERQRRKLAQT